MEPKSVSYRIGDGKWQELTWEPTELAYVSTDRKIKVTKPKSDDGNEPIRAIWEGSEYRTKPCSPAADETLCAIPEKNVQIRFLRFAASAPAIPRSGGSPAAPTPAPARPAPAPLPASAAPGALLNPQQRAAKLAEWVRLETRVDRDTAFNMAGRAYETVHKAYGKKGISEGDLRIYYDGFIQQELKRTRGIKKEASLGRPRDIDLGTPKGGKPAAAGKPGPSVVASAVDTKFPDTLGFDAKFRKAAAQKIEQALKKYPSADEKNKQLGILIKTIQDALQKHHKVGEKIEPLPMGLKYPAARGKPEITPLQILERRLGGAYPEDTPRAEAKAAILADLKARFGKRSYSLPELLSALNRYQEKTKTAEQRQLAADAAKAAAAEKKTISGYRKTLDAATKAFERLEAIDKLPAAEQNSIRAAELVALHDAVDAFDTAHAELKALPTPSAAIKGLIGDFDILKPRYASAMALISKLVAQQAAEHVSVLTRYAEDMRKTFAAIDVPAFRTAKFNFLSRYNKGLAFLTGVADIEPQTERIATINKLRSEVIKLNPASIRGDEKDLRTTLNAINAALKKRPTLLHPHVRSLLAVEGKLDTVRAGLKPEVAKEFDATLTQLRVAIKAQQDVILKTIYGHEIRLVKGFSHKIDFNWLTDDTTRPETKEKAEAAIKALEGLLGVQPWDHRLLLTRGSTLTALQERYENAKTVLNMIREYEKTRRAPELDAATPPTAAEIARLQAEAAADAAYRPIEAKLTAAVDAVEVIYGKLFDKSRKWQARTQGPPYVDELPELLSSLETLEKELNGLNVDPSVDKALGRDRKVAADRLSDRLTEAYSRIRIAQNRIRSIRGDDIRFYRTAQLEQEADAIGKKIADAPLPDLQRMRRQLADIQEVLIDRFADHTDKAAPSVLKKIKPILASLDLRIRTLGGAPPEVVAQPGPPAEPKVEPRLSPQAADLKASVDDLLRELSEQSMLLASVGDDKDKLGDVQNQRRRIAHILAAAEARPSEKKMGDVIWKAQRLLKRIDAKIVELGGTPPLPEAAPKPPPTLPPRTEPAREAPPPAAAGEPAVIMPLAEAQKELRAAEARFKKFNTTLKGQTLAQLIALRAALLDVMVNSAWSEDELRGRDARYRRQSELGRAFNKKVGSLEKDVTAEISGRLDKRMDGLKAVKAQAENAVRTVDPLSLTEAKAATSRVAEALLKDLEAIGKTEWEPDDLQRRRAAIKALVAEVQGLEIRSSAVRAKADAEAKTIAAEAAHARSALFGRMQTRLREIQGELKSRPTLERLDALSRDISEALAQLQPLLGTDFDTQAKSAIAGFEAAQKEITALRDSHQKARLLDELQSRASALQAEADRLKDPKDLATIKAHFTRLGEIRDALKKIHDTEIPEDGAALKSRIGNFLSALALKLGELEEAIRRLEPSAPTPAGAPPDASAALKEIRGRMDGFNAKGDRFSSELMTNPDLATESKFDEFLQDVATIEKDLSTLDGLGGIQAVSSDAASLKTLLVGVKDTLIDNAALIIMKVIGNPPFQSKPLELRLRKLQTFSQQIDGLKTKTGSPTALQRISAASDNIQAMIQTLERKKAGDPLSAVAGRIANILELRGHVYLTPDNKGIEIRGVTRVDMRLKTVLDGIVDNIDPGDPDIPKRSIAAATFAVNTADLIQDALFLQSALSSRKIPDVIALEDTRVTAGFTSLILHFDKAAATAYRKAMEGDVRGLKAAAARQEREAEAARLKPLKNLQGIARSRGGSAVESDKDAPILGKQQVYAARVRVPNADAALRFIRLVAQALDKTERSDFLVFAHPDIASGLADGPSKLKIENRDDQPGSRIYALAPSQAGEMYIVIPAKSKNINIGNAFGEGMTALWPVLRPLGFPNKPVLSKPKVPERPKSQEPAAIAPPLQNDRAIIPGGTVASLPPMKKKKIHGLGQVTPKWQRAQLGRLFPDAVIWNGDLDANSYETNSKGVMPAKARLAAVAELYKQHGYTRVLAIYTAPPSNKGTPSAAQTRYENQFVGIAKEVGGSQGIPIQTVYVTIAREMDDQPDNVTYVPLRDSDDADAIIAQYRKFAAEVSKGN